MRRRTFLGSAAAALAGSAAATETRRKTVGIQIGAVSFQDEGIERVLDIVQERGRVNTVFLVTLAYNDGLAGRQIAGQPFPDHGKQEHDRNFVGGYYAIPNPRYYSETSFRQFRAPDAGDFDILGQAVPVARKRGLRTVAFLADNIRRTLPGVQPLLERGLEGQPLGEVCFNSPDYRAFLLGLVEDCLRSYDLDALLWRSERAGSLSRVLGLHHNGPSEAGCFCSFCQKKAAANGIDFARARQGCAKLAAFTAASRKGARAVDGQFVEVLRILMQYPEILAWESFWHASLREMYASVYRRAKEVKPEVEIGWAIAHSSTTNPLYRAAQDLKALCPHSDFLKMVMYHNAGGPRMLSFLKHAGAAIGGEVPLDEMLSLEYRIMGYDREAAADRLAQTGFSDRFVYAHTRRAVESVAGTATRVFSGIDVDLPTGAKDAKCTPEGTRNAVLAAFRAGADGIVLARKYSEMRLANISGAGEAIRELGIG